MGKLQKKGDSQLLFEVKSKLGLLIRTTVTYWNIIANVKHPSIRDKEKQVIKTLTCSDEIRISKKVNNIYLFYRKYSNMYLCIVAKILKKEGFIITAYYTRKIKEGIVKWKK